MKKLLFILVIGISEVLAITDEVPCTWVIKNFQIDYGSRSSSVYVDFEKNKDKYSCYEVQKGFVHHKKRRFVAINSDSTKYIGLSFENEKEIAYIGCLADNRKLTVDHIISSGSEKLLGDKFTIVYKERLIGETFLNSDNFSDYLYPPPRKIPVIVCDRQKNGYDLIDFVYIGKIPSFITTNEFDLLYQIRFNLLQLDGGD